MKYNNLISAALLLSALVYSNASTAQSQYDQNKPFGFCTVSSRTDAASKFDISGGGGFIFENGQVKDENGSAVDASKIIILKSSDVTKDDVVKNAIRNYSIVIFDGSEGDFIISQQIVLDGQKNKTIMGINNARLCSKFVVSQEIREVIAASGANTASTSGGGGTLSNGVKVSEAAEYLTRQAIIDYTGDSQELYRKAGIFNLKSTCSNLIIRNLKFVGPGAIDAGAYDLISATGAKHVWVDHCDFTDGMDGNFDITNSSDFFTVSWCTFSYTERSYMHQNTNLVGSSDSEAKGYLNTTYAFNIWDNGCKQRMPMARAGKIHMLNNYFNPGSKVSNCINPRANSELLIEGNYFAKEVNSSSKILKIDASATACTVGSGNVASVSIPSGKGNTVTVPYEYINNNAEQIKDELIQNAGATLYTNVNGNLSDGIPFLTVNNDEDKNNKTFLINGTCTNSNTKGIVIRNNKKIINM